MPTATGIACEWVSVPLEPVPSVDAPFEPLVFVVTTQFQCSRVQYNTSKGIDKRTCVFSRRRLVLDIAGLFCASCSHSVVNVRD